MNKPVATHFEYARKALLAGKHIVVEKAFTTTVAEAEEVLTALAKEKRVEIDRFPKTEDGIKGFQNSESNFC